MKKLLISLIALVQCVVVFPQQKSDPVIMTINGQPVLRSEFEYSFNKNNDDDVIDKKTVSEYADLFIIQWEEMRKFYPNAIYTGLL